MKRSNVCIILFTLAVVACGPTHQATKTFTFDPKSTPVKISPPKNLDLASKTVYSFTVTGVNSAYHAIDYNVTKEKKNVSVPTVLAAVIPSGASTSTVTHEMSMNLNGRTATRTVSKDDLIDSVYNLITDYYKRGKTDIDNMNDHWDQFGNCQKTANQAISDLCGEFNATSADAEGLLKAVRSAIIDFNSRFSLMKDAGDVNDDERGVSLYKAARFVDSAQTFLLKIPSVLKAYQKCEQFIVSGTYDHKKADYLNVSFTIYKDKSHTHDSVCSINTTFYRSNYITFDVSAGAFMTNLATPSFHFTDSLGHFAKEAKATTDLSIGALIHLQYVTSSWFKPGICVGAGVSVLDGKTKYLGGLSLMFGRRNEFCLSGGAALAILPAPSNAVAATGYVSAPETAVPTYNKTTWGSFVGLSYSFIKN